MFINFKPFIRRGKLNAKRYEQLFITRIDMQFI